MANEFIIRKGYIALEDSQITGSLSVTNSVTASFFTGSYRGDGSQLTGIEGFPFTGSAGITGSLTVVGPVNATTFTGDGSQLTGIEGFPFTGSAKITGSLEVTGSVTATSFTGSIQGIATSASYVQLANVDGFTAYSASVNTAIDSVLDATTPLTATVNTTNSPFTITSQSIVIIDSTNGDVTVNLPDLNAINGTPDQKPILLYKNDYSQNVIYVQPSGSQLVNGTTQDIIVSIQIAIAYNPTSAGWVTEGTSYQSLAELEMFFVPRTETGSFATTGSNQFSGSQAITGSLTVTGNITGSASTASYVEYANVANKPAIVSGSSQITYSGLTGIPSGIVSGSSQITYSGLTGIPSGIVSGSAQIADFGIFATTGSNQFNGNQSITGSLTVSGQVVAQTLNVQQVTSSIVFSSGSNIFGNSLSNTQQFTGSVGVTGSLTVAGAGTFSNFVGINGSPGTSFPLEAYINSSTTYTTSSRGNVMRVYNSNTTANVFAGIELGGAGTANDGLVGINGVVTGSGNGAMTFYTRNSNTFSEKLRLESAGNIGVGTISPSDFIDAGLGLAIISTTGRTGLSLGSTQTTADEVLGRLSFTNTNSTNIGSKRLAYISGVRGNTNNSAYLEFGTANNGLGTQRMVISQEGNVGIGVTPNANSRLHVYRGGGSYDTIIADGDAGTNTGFAIYEGGSARYALYSNGAGGNDSFNIYNFGASSNSLTITTGGNVGIGNTTPNRLLSLYATTPVLQFTNPTTGVTANDGTQFFQNAANFTLELQDSGYFNILTGGSERMRIIPDAISTVEIVGATATNDNYPRLRFKGGTYPDADSKYPYIQLGNGGLALSLNSGTSTTFNNPAQISLNNGTIFFSTAAATSSPVSRMEISSLGYVTTDPNSSTNGGLIARGIEYSIMSVGSLTGYTQGAIVVSSGTGSTPSARGQGIFYFNEGNDITWYNGGLYNATDRWDICRKTGTSAIDASTAQTAFTLFNLNSSGAAYNATGTWGTISSDQRLKENIVDATSKLDDVMSLKVRNFNYIGKEEKYIGFIAQELEEVFPSLVTTNDMREFDRDGNVVGGLEDTKGVKVGMDFAILVKAIQEQQAQIEILKAEIQTLKQ